jgi:hypothetical protein
MVQFIVSESMILPYHQPLTIKEAITLTKGSSLYLSIIRIYSIDMFIHFLDKLERGGREWIYQIFYILR